MSAGSPAPSASRPQPTAVLPRVDRAVRRSVVAPFLVVMLFGATVGAQVAHLRGASAAAEAARDAVSSERQAEQVLASRQHSLDAFARTHDAAFLDSARDEAEALPAILANLRRSGESLPEAIVASDELRALNATTSRAEEPSHPGEVSARAEEPSHPGEVSAEAIPKTVTARLSALEAARSARESTARRCAMATFGGLVALTVLLASGIALYSRRVLTTLSLDYASAIRKLGQARDDAEGASRSKDELLSAVGHDLRAPLTSILGWTMMLRRCPNDPEIVCRATERIDRSARAQARVVEELLDFSRRKRRAIDASASSALDGGTLHPRS